RIPSYTSRAFTQSPARSKFMPLSIARAVASSSLAPLPLAFGFGFDAVVLGTTGARASLFCVAERGGDCFTVDQGDGRLGHDDSRAGVAAHPAPIAGSSRTITVGQPQRTWLICSCLRWGRHSCLPHCLCRERPRWHSCCWAGNRLPCFLVAD